MISNEELFEGKIIYDKVSNDTSILTLYKSLNKHLSKEGELSPELILYSSYNKLTETKYIKDIKSKREKVYLLFDMHLMDFLGEFVEAYIEEKYFLKLTRCLTYRVLAENFFIKGKFNETFYCAYRYLASEGCVRFTKKRNEQMAQSLLIQESFVLCHELAHWYLFRCNINRESLIENKKELWIEYLNKYIEKRRAKSDSDGTKLLSEMKDYINTQGKIIEECTCDTFAVVFLINYAEGINQYSKIDVIKNSFIAIQSLQLLSFAEKYVDIISGFQGNNEKIYLEMTLRMIIYKAYFRNYLEQYHKDAADIFENEMIACVECYSNHITSVFNELLDKTQMELLRLKNLPQTTFLDDSWETISIFAKNLLCIDDR